MYKYVMGGSKEHRAKLFTVVPSDRMRGSRHKLKYRKFHLSIRKTLFYCEGGRKLAQFPREAMETPSLEIFKT